MCPPHLTAKWEREIRHVLPVVVVLQLKRISDVDRFFAAPASADKPVVGIMKETSARSASGWEHGYQWCGSVRHKALPKQQGKRAKHAIHFQSALVRAVEENAWENDSERVEITVAGRSRSVSIQALLHYVRERRPPMSPDSGTLLLDGSVPLRPVDFGRKQHRRTLPTRRGRSAPEPLYQFTRRLPTGRRSASLHEALRRHDRIRTNLAAGYAAYSPLAPHRLTPALSDGYAKWPLATYILKRYKGQIDLLICDEAHEMKGHDSDRGYAFGRLVAASKKVLGLTGTVYGGRASTLFSLLYRMSRQMQQTYGHRDVGRWTAEYGVLQEIERVHFDADGRQTGNRRSNVTVKELPGASPAMMRWLLDRAVFVALADLGFALPDYVEEPILLDMSPPMQAQYDVLHATLKAELNEMLIRNDRSLLAAYLQALLAWPDSPWRAKVVRHPRTEQIVASIPGLPQLPVGMAPKEAALVGRIKAEVAQGRNVLLLCQQTNTLDITPQWKDLLERHGIRTAVLTVDPAQRKAWIDKQAERGTQVIISHPRRVQTGLDLLDFPTILWMAIDYSVYTVKQASRRSFRIGQTDDVSVQFYAYRGTLQEQALRLVAAKMAATNRIDGNTVATDSLSELDDIVQGDLITTLARIVVGEEGLVAPDLADSFASANGALHDNLAYLDRDMALPALLAGGWDEALPLEQLLVAVDDEESADPSSLAAESFLAVEAPLPVHQRPTSLLQLLRGRDG